MSENCTIYCRKIDLEWILDMLRSVFSEVEVTGNPLHWDSVLVRGNEGVFRISSKQFTEAGDDFSRLKLSTYNFFDRIRTRATDSKRRLLKHIENCELILGVVTEPGFESDKRYEETVFAIARELRGNIFDGNGMMDHKGILILDNNGQTGKL